MKQLFLITALLVSAQSFAQETKKKIEFRFVCSTYKASLWMAIENLQKLVDEISDIVDVSAPGITADKDGYNNACVTVKIEKK